MQKKLEEMNKQREIFVKGAKEKHNIEKKKVRKKMGMRKKVSQQ